MNQNKINSLYSLVKQKSQEKGRPLKIICDWDECLQALNSCINYKICEKYKLLPFISFEDFFKIFWEKVQGDFRSHGIANLNINIEELERFKKSNSQKYNESFAEIKKDFEFYNKMPYLSIFKELLLASKEKNLVEVISSFRKDLKDYNKTNFHPVKGDLRKIGIYQKTFAKFPQTRIEIYKITRNNPNERSFPHRWDWIKENCQDFDIFIDDNHVIIENTVKNFGSEKIYVMPDYKHSRHIQGPNIYHLKNNVSDLKDEDFAKAAEEYKNNISKNKEKFDGKSIWLWTAGVTLILGFIIAMIYVTKRIKRKK